jgi:hypothetical protein
MQVHEEILDGITYVTEIEQEYESVRGNALASGDDAEDKAAEDEILRQLDSGNLWAWCTVVVTAKMPIGDEVFEGRDTLGCCSYRDTKDFVCEEGYYPDMRSEAKEDLKRNIEASVKRGEVAELALNLFAK